MHLLPPSPRPFGVFAERSEVPLAQWEVDLQTAEALENSIRKAWWARLIDEVVTPQLIRHFVTALRDIQE